VAYGIAGFAFARSFLDTPSTLPRATRALEIVTAAAVVALAAAMALGTTQVAALWVSFAFVTFFSFAMLALGIYAFRANVPSSGYFLLASIASMAGTAFTSLSVWGWIAFSAWRYRAVEVGTLIDATLLALALGGQFRLIEMARGAADRARSELANTNERLNASLREVERLAATDRLTGLWNRLHLERVAATEMERAARYGHATSLLAIDLDHFKRVNDTRGHREGDEVLIEVAQLARERVREVDVVTRWGGEEFLILMPNTTLREAAMAAEALRRMFEIHVFRDGIRLTISVGVAEWRPGEETLEAWFARADRALYRAKEAGRNRFMIDDQPAEALAT
jgi:diguanylate cyclase (GGDEF)-like protein